MANTNGGGPAFPILDVHQPWNRERKEYDGVKTDVIAPGMELRDYFAAKAMAVLLLGKNWPLDQIADTAYEMAAAMLRARAAQSPAERQAAHLDTFGEGK